jgi:ornithine carbamoyltransferase
LHRYAQAVYTPAVIPNSRSGHRPDRLLSIADLGADGVADVLEQAAALKSAWAPGVVSRAGQPLAGRAVALLFDRPSLRTRVSFEVGISRLGGTSTVLTGESIGLGSREPMVDIARTLARYVDAIVIRSLDHAAVEELADASAVPVVNALTAREHPCQALADLLTLHEHLGPLAGRWLAYVGDGNNVCHSLLLAAAAAGLNLRVATPPGHEPAPDIVDMALAQARETGAQLELMSDPRAAVSSVDAVYTDVWASMGSEHEAAERKRALSRYALTPELLSAAPDALVMHCLPAHRGEEISDEVIEGPRSVVFDQAENRLWAQQAVLLRLLRASSLRPAVHAPERMISMVAAG